MTNINDKDISTLIFYSFRYALGRRTYCVQDVTDLINKYWQYMLKEDKDLIKKEIMEYKLRNTKIGDLYIDEPLWMKILDLP